MLLYIAEKPSLGRAIAAALSQPQQKGDGFIRLANGDCVSWCIGHLLEQAEPDAYDAAYKQWRAEHLPIIPQQWQLKARSSTRKQLTVLRKLVKEADQLVHAGDPDREGQLLVDEVINHLGVSAKKRDATMRCLISDLNPSAVRRALATLRSNKEFIPLSTSALARARADWLYGINMTRAYTLQGRKAGYAGLLSVGRVQTPLLGLVVRRDQAIDDFVAKTYYDVDACLQTPPSTDASPQDSPAGTTFKARWQPSDACARHQDEEGRVLSKALAENVVQRITDQPATVSTLERKLKRSAPPLPYNLSALQIDAARRFGLSAQQVLDGCQALYEQHKLITYPRSDCRYLPLEHHREAATVIRAIANNCPDLGDATIDADAKRQSKAWNDSKVDAHHAIIPTSRQAAPARLSQSERQIYQQISRQYLCQFYPEHRYQATRVELTIQGGCFVAKARQTEQVGWKVLFPARSRGAATGTDSTGRSDGQQPPDSQDEPEQELPALYEGQVLHCLRGELLEKLTQAPKPFNDATLLAAMTGIARYVEDAQIRRILKENDGLGTEATRAGIIELLFKRQFLVRNGKQIRATATGKALIAALPTVATTPDMTANWEAQLNGISQRQLPYQAFMAPLTQTLRELIQKAVTSPPPALQGIKAAAPGSRRRGAGKSRKARNKPRTARASAART